MRPESETEEELQMQTGMVGSDMARFILKVKGVPPEIRQSLEIYLEPVIALSNHTFDTVNQVLSMYDHDAALYLAHVRGLGKTEREEAKIVLALDQIRVALMSNLLRSVGQKRERVLLATSFKETKGEWREAPLEKKRSLLHPFGRGD